MTQEVLPNCEHCSKCRDCFLAEYIKSACVLIASLFWPKDKADWPFKPTETKEVLYRNIAERCKSFTAADCQRI